MLKFSFYVFKFVCWLSNVTVDIIEVQELKQLADEIRSEISFLMPKIDVPFKASLAVVELTIAMHRVFHAPADKILWDVGEQVRIYAISNNSVC